jgi:hypothetical protein
MTITINDMAVTNSLSFTLMSEIEASVTIDPASASPVLKTQL